jgi:hypothetical protein
MTDLHWFESLVAVHALLALVAIVMALRVQGYTPEQRRLQVLLAALLPAIGPVIVYVMAREADAPMPPPRNTRFDRADG